jgi:hypothetical protein
MFSSANQSTAIVLACIVAMPSMSAMSQAASADIAYMRASLRFNGTSWPHVQVSFDALIDGTPLAIVVSLSRGFHPLWMDVNKKSPWDWDKCKGDIMYQHHFILGLKVFIRAQYTMVHDKSMASTKRFYEELHAKIIDMMQWRVEWLERYPDATLAIADRAMLLMSDINIAIHEVQMNIIHHASGEVLLTLQAWKITDPEKLMPLFCYMESAPGSSIQSVPVMLHNALRPDGCRIACAALPTNGFMMFRKPTIIVTTFVLDTFDEEVRRPMVRFIDWITSMDPSVRPHVDVVMQPPDVVWGEFDIHLMIDLDEVMQPPVD